MLVKERCNPDQLGWAPGTLGEIDHRLVRAPYVRLVSFKQGIRGDTVYVFDLRVTRPNRNYLTPLQMHSLEHFLLAGFRKHLPATFVSIAPMGCQTGFYLVTMNEGRAEEICEAYNNSLGDILKASAVPYANINNCGQYLYHDLEQAKNVAEMVLRGRHYWLCVFREDYKA